MEPKKALAFVRKHGVVLVSGKGPVPRFSEAVAGEPIKGSWWGHPEGHRIFAALQHVADSKDVLVCRVVEGKITLVHRRLWPALVRVASLFPKNQLAWIRQEHTSKGHHVNREIPFHEWVTSGTKDQAGTLSEEEALQSLGPWVLKSKGKGKRNARSTTRSRAGASTKS